MLQKYNIFNESKKNRNRRSGIVKNSKGILVWDGSRVRGNQSRDFTPQPRGMNMDFSPRFRYILGKIDKKGNKIAKDLIAFLNKPDAKFEFSYIDLTGRADTLSYIANADRNIPEEEKYKTNKRQQSKVYKIIKTIFGSKYTKTEVNKFVSIYKQVYEEGPDEAAISKSKRPDEQLVKKIANDTRNGTLKWNKVVSDIINMDRFEATIKVTERKCIWFIFFILNEKKLSFVTINLFDKQFPGKSGEWIQTYQYKELGDFIKAFKEKYNIDVT
jgi:hypothetical protein